MRGECHGHYLPDPERLRSFFCARHGVPGSSLHPALLAQVSKAAGTARGLSLIEITTDLWPTFAFW